MSRYFKVVYDDFTDFGDELERNHSYWQERVEALASLFEKFLPDSFQGETADSINLYFNEVHGYILAGLYELMEISKRNFLMYKNDYYELIDASLHAVISEYELEHIADTMKRYKLELEDYHYELKQTLNSVSDIVRIKEPSAEDLYDDYEAVIKYVEKLRDDILDLEAKHKREDFVEFNEVKARLTSFMDEVSSKGRSFKENYQTKAVSGLDSFADYNTALMAAESYIESTQERYEKALAAEAIRIEKLKAEQRIVDGTVRVIASLVVVAGIIILSGGTLAPAAIPTVIFAYGELTEGANNIYLGLEGDGSSIAFNHIRDTIFLGNQLTYDIAAFGIDIGAIKFSKPTITNLNQVVKYGAKSTTSGSTSRIRDLTKKLLGKVDDVGDVKNISKGVSAVDEVLEGGSERISQLLKKSTCSSDELYTYLSKQAGSDAAKTFAKNGTWPSKIQIPKNSSVLDLEGRIKWSKAPQGGYTLDANGNAIKEKFVPKVGEVIDRYGPADGRYASPVIEGRSFEYTERTLPYVEDTSRYEVVGDFSKIEDYVKNCTKGELKKKIDASVTAYYDGNYSNLVSFKGEAARIEGWGKGGAIQYEFSLSIEQLEELGLLAEIK